MAATLYGIDIGTTSICGVAVSESGELLAVQQRPNDSRRAGLPSGRSEQSPAIIFERAAEVLAGLSERAPDPAAIGLTGQMHGMLCVDNTNKPLTPLINWQDARCLEPTGQGGNWVRRMLDRAGTDAWENCGCLPASGFMGSTLYWLKENGQLPADTDRVCFIHDWIAAQLCDEMPVTDPSDAGSAGVYDLAGMCWHDDLLKALDLPGHLLPPVRESGQVIGRLGPSSAQEAMLKPGVPVCNAIGDNQASVIGSLADIDGSILLNLGTGGQISWSIPEFIRVQGMETRYLPVGRFMLVGASLCGGRSFAWLRDVVSQWVGTFGVKVDSDTIYAKLTALAASAPAGAAGLKVRTTFSGRRDDPGLRGGVDGVSLDNFSLGNVSRAVLEGLVEELCAWYDRLAYTAERGHEQVVASGNAVRKNELLARIIAERLHRPVCVPSHDEEAAFGAALLAGVNSGVWSDLSEAGRAIRYL